MRAVRWAVAVAMTCSSGAAFAAYTEVWNPPEAAQIKPVKRHGAGAAHAATVARQNASPVKRAASPVAAKQARRSSQLSAQVKTPLKTHQVASIKPALKTTASKTTTVAHANVKPATHAASVRHFAATTTHHAPSAATSLTSSQKPKTAHHGASRAEPPIIS